MEDDVVTAVATIVLCTVAILCSGCARGGGSTAPHVRLAIGGQNQLVYLPTTLAQELGYYKEEGLDVELQDFQGGSKALQALIGGSSDVVSGFYDHTIQMAADGRELVAFVMMLQYPGLVLATAPDRADAVTKVEDLRGRIVGVTSAGSSSQMFLTYLLHRHQVPVDSVSVTAIGSAATAIAAVEHGKVDAAWLADPSFTFVRHRNPKIRVLADLRDAAGVQDAFGASVYPSAVLYTKGEWMRANQATVGRLARAVVRTLEWMHGHSAQEVAAKTPKSFRGDDDGVFVDALKGSMAMYSPDGLMTEEGAQVVRALLADSMEKVRGASIDLSKTFTNVFVRPPAP
jgi:sulfonate transport system substrate-binding protein